MQTSGPQRINKFNELVRDIPEGKWVVVNDDQTEIIVVGDFCREVIEEAKAKGVTNPELVRIKRRHF